MIKDLLNEVCMRAEVAKAIERCAAAFRLQNYNGKCNCLRSIQPRHMSFEKRKIHLYVKLHFFFFPVTSSLPLRFVSLKIHREINDD